MTNTGRQYPEAYIRYMAEFHGTRDFFECHEIMEEYWKSCGDGPLKPIWLGLIQVAVSRYHERRGNFPGALKMITQACRNLSEEGLNVIGIDAHEMLRQLSELRRELEDAVRGGVKPYRELDLPIRDPELLRQCREACDREGFVWLAPSPYHDASVIHRHKLRDRSAVVEERRRSLEAKKQGRQEGGNAEK